MLRALVLTFNHQAGGQVHNTDCRIRFVNVLTARARCAKGIDTQIGFIDINFFHFIRFPDPETLSAIVDVPCALM